jgi:hypothetical protein
MRIALILAVATLAACGGGDSGGETDPALVGLDGTYSATMKREVDNCGITTQYNGANHVIGVNGSEATVTINTLTMKGQANGYGGVNAGYDVTSADGVRTQAWTSYTPVPGSPTPATSFSVILNIVGSTGGFSCVVTYSGTVTKIS